jgi:phosphatidylglycerophosphate synthase
MHSSSFKDATRVHTSVLAGLEKRTLVWLARRMPRWVTSDHLTGLAAVAMLMAGLCYWASRWNRLVLLAVILWLAVNWFGDSLDGTLARVRNRLRPRHGFYVDHVLDAFGILFLVGGLALSGFMSAVIALTLLVVYLLLLVEVCLATYTLGEFRLSFWKFGPTELRLVLAVGNLVLLVRGPHATIAGRPLLLFDIGALVATVGIAATVVVSVVTNTRALYRAGALP